MQKNIILFIIDSLNYSHLQDSDVELMPFLRELEAQGIYCDNMFSQAPYTEAAVMNLYCGQDVLQDNGYLFRFRDAKTTIFEEMKKAGYVTFYNSFQPQCYPSSVRRGVDYLYYNVGYDQSALWSYRLQHYSDCYKAGEISEKDLLVLKDIFEDNFREWLRFIDDIINDDESTKMISNNSSDYDAEKVRRLVLNEVEQYNNNRDAYIFDVLTVGYHHRLFSIPAYVQNQKIQKREVISTIREEMTPLFNRIKSMNLKLNIQNCKGLLKGPLKKTGVLLRNPRRQSVKDLLKSVYLVVNELKDVDLFQRIDQDCDWFKNAPSGRTHINHYLQWANDHKNEGPHFACIHIDDIHNPEVFFTYDTDDLELIKSEKAAAEKILEKIPSTYYGSLTHDLSLGYIDGVIKYFYEQLEQRGMLENTCIAICADHGFSFSGNPLRDSFVINLFLENYNIPCVFTGTGLDHKAIHALRTSKDIPATICALAKGEIPEGFSGHSVLEDYQYPRVQIEYCGGGCPDLSKREIKLASFDKKYLVGTLCRLDEPLTENKVTEVYDLERDPEQLHNLIGGTFDVGEIQQYLIHIDKRRKEIVRSMK